MACLNDTLPARDEDSQYEGRKMQKQKSISKDGTSVKMKVSTNDIEANHYIENKW